MRTRLASAGNVECGTVIRRGADKIEAKRDIYATIKICCFQWNKDLIMIHANRSVIGFACFRVEEGICRKRPESTNTLIFQSFHSRCDDALVLVTKLAVLTGMRVEATHRDAG